MRDSGGARPGGRRRLAATAAIALAAAVLIATVLVVLERPLEVVVQLLLLVVALIGVWSFNWFNNKIESVTDDMNVAVQEFLDWCEKQILPPMEEAAK